MSLPVSQRRNLDEIEDSLRASDPQLASLFTIFTRLNHDEEMPRIEQLKADAAGLWAWLRIRPAAAGRWLAVSSGARFRAAVLFPMALAAMACTMLLAMGNSGAQRCISAPRAVGTSQLTTRPRDKARVRAGTKTGAGSSAKARACSPALWPDGMMGR
jgi:hypothetical protein